MTSGSCACDVATPDAPYTKDVLCYKCKETPATVRTRGQPSCKACAVQYVEATFRTALRVKCRVTRGNAVVVCVSESLPSQCLWNLIVKGQSGLMENWKNRLGLTVLATVHVDLASLYFQKSPHGVSGTRPRPNDHAHVRPSPASFRGPCKRSGDNLRQWFASSTHPFELLDPLRYAFSAQRAETCEELRSLFYTLHHRETLQSRDAWVFKDLSTILIQRSLYGYFLSKEQTAWPRSVTALLGTTGTKVATEALELLCKGAGASIPLASHFLDERYISLDALSHGCGAEIAEYMARCCHSGGNGDSGDCTAASRADLDRTEQAPIAEADSLNALVNSFVTTLQQSNPQSIMTVVQTLDKLGTRAVEKNGNVEAHDTPDASASSMRVPPVFLYGTCMCCLGPIEEPAAKASVLTWGKKSRENLSSLHVYHAAGDSGGHSDETLLSSLSTLCLRCIRLAAASPSVAHIVVQLQQTSKTYDAIPLAT